MSDGNETTIDGSKETSGQQDAPKNPIVNFYDLIKNGTIVRSSHEFTGYEARLTIRHANGHEYEVRAWNDGLYSDAEADTDDVDFDPPTDDKELPQFLIEEAAYDRENIRDDASALRLAARSVIAAWEDGNLAEAVN